MVEIDAKMMLLVQQNDVDAFDQLYFKYHQPVYKNILKIIKDQEAAEDILQEVFIKFWEKRHTIDTLQSIAGWLFTVSFNFSVNYTRKKLRDQTLQKELFRDENYTDTDFRLYEEQHQLLEKAIEQLSPQKNKIVRLCKLEGKTYAEAALELNISHHTVKEYLSSAMVNLNDFVRKHSTTKNNLVLLVVLLML